jgi:uncharacterized protein
MMGLKECAMTMDHGKRCGQGNRIVRCPACKKEVPFEGNPYRPFCSRGCKGLDLIHWASDGYRIEGKTDEDGKDEDGG